jgi:hypothetical protein
MFQDAVGEQVAGNRELGERDEVSTCLKSLRHHFEVPIEVSLELTRAGRDLRQGHHKIALLRRALPHTALRRECNMMTCWRYFSRF